MSRLSKLLSKWSRKKQQQRDPALGSSTGQEETRPVPALSERSRALTPSASRENLCQSVYAATNGSSFFQKLPFEIRRKILVEAFGGRTIHMDLWYDHPEMPLPEDPSLREEITQNSHCNRHYDSRHQHRAIASGPAVVLDMARPKQWIWRSSECHQRSPSGRRTVSISAFGHPPEDRCRYGDAHIDFCRAWPGSKPHKCFIGAIGWLLSCRQAYSEGIGVLYGTNTIHTASRQMILELDKLLLPQRLSSIRSIELLWEFAPFPSRRADRVRGPCTNLRSFHRLLDKIPMTFTGARSIYISLQGELGIYEMHSHQPTPKMWASIRKTEEELLMGPVDAMARKLGPDVQCLTVAIMSSMYMSRRTEALKENAVVEQVHLNNERERYWRQLSGSSSLEGYWVELGYRDLERPYYCTMGEGFPEGFWPDEEEVFYASCI